MLPLKANRKVETLEHGPCRRHIDNVILREGPAAEIFGKKIFHGMVGQQRLEEV